MKNNENIKATNSYKIQVLKLKKPGDQVLVVETHKNLSSRVKVLLPVLSVDRLIIDTSAFKPLTETACAFCCKAAILR